MRPLNLAVSGRDDCGAPAVPKPQPVAARPTAERRRRHPDPEPWRMQRPAERADLEPAISLPERATLKNDCRCCWCARR